jgi:DNA repair photolyase
MAQHKIHPDLVMNYSSPRWSGEILDCAIPMTFDQYDHCAMNCMYCFSYFQKSLKVHNPLFTSDTKSYQAMPVRSVNPETVRKIFSLEEKSQFEHLIKNKITLQWGGLSDPFDGYEKKYGIGLECMRHLAALKYPIRFSTKSAWWIEDERYASLVKGRKNWNLMVSITNLDEKLARLIDRGVPPPQKRFEVLEKWVELGAGDAILRLRPFIIGMADVNDEYLQMIEIAASIGCKAVSTEFFCLENRGDDTTRVRYEKMSEALGFDLVNFYRTNSPGQTGYLRLNWAIKKPFIDKMDALCKKLGLRFSVSDAHHKERGTSGGCCSLGDNMKVNEGQFTQVLLTAKQRYERGEDSRVYFSDIKPHLEKMGFDTFLWRRAQNFNTNSTVMRTQRYNMTMLGYFREIWNSPNTPKSPYKYFHGLLYPVGVDEEKNVIYEYRPYATQANGVDRKKLKRDRISK